jgi:hypothetical protein
MMVIVCRLAQLARVDGFRKLGKGKHRIVFTVLAEKRSVVAEIHIFQMISDKTAETALGALSELLQNLIVGFFLHFAIVVQKR